MRHAQPAKSASDTLELLWDAIEALSEGIAVFDASHRLVISNQRYREMFPLIDDLIRPGVSREDLLRAGAERGQYVDALGRQEEWLQDRLKAGVPLGQTLEVELTGGSVYQVQYSATNKSGFVVTNSDITERRQAESVAREQETILQTVLDASPVAVVMARQADGRILYRSPGAVAQFGNTESAFEHYVTPKDREDYIDALTKTGSVDDYRVLYRNAKGEVYPATAWGRLVEFNGDTCVVSVITDLSDQQEQENLIRQVLEACPTPIQMTKAETGEVLFSSPETIALFGRVDSSKQFYAESGTRDKYLKELRSKGEVAEYKAEYINAKGEKFWGAVSARLIQYDGEEVIVSHTRDLTEQHRIEAELTHQQNQLYQNEKMSAMGELLAGVAHELNNPLSVVVGHSLMLREDCKDPDILRQIEKISGAAERCAKIVKTFLTMARQQPVKMHRVDINEIIQTAVDVARYGEIGDSITIDCDLAPELPYVCADPDQITQVFINLFLNAEQAIRESGTGTGVTVATRRDKKGKGINITVADDGPGVPEHLHGRVFEPFFTTKDVGEGIGIGLALCHRIVQTHNGQITLQGNDNAGSTFTIFVPRDMAAPAPTQTTEASEEISDSTRILIVDDEADVAELNAEILARSGYQVDVFRKAAEAVESMRNTDYELILSDLNMPDIDGRRFFEIIKQTFPDKIDRVGFVTGDTMGNASQMLLNEANRPYIEKPVAPKELRAFVAEILSNAKQVEV